MGSKQILDGIRILDFGSFIAGPAGTMMMSFFGAEVIKVEHPVRFDGGRFFQTGLGHPPPDPVYGTQFFDVSNLNKKSVVVDYSTTEGQEILKELILTCDVLMENMIPGSLSKYGFGYEDVKKYHPSIIYVSSCSCGQTGPETYYRGYAGHFAAKSGLSMSTGYENSLPPIFVGGVDFRSATNSVMAMMLGLLHKQKTGEGQYIDIASQEAIAAQLGDVYLDTILNGTITKRQGDKRSGYCPNVAFRTKGDDEWLSISCYTDKEFKDLCKVMEKPEMSEDPRFITYDARKANEDELNEIITSWTIDKDKFALWKLLRTENVPSTPSMSAKETAQDSHNILMASCVPIDHPFIGRDYVVSPPWRRMSESEIKAPVHAPPLGADTRDYLKELGKTDAEIDELEAKKVIKTL